MNFLFFEEKRAVHVYLAMIIFFLFFDFFFFDKNALIQAFDFSNLSIFDLWDKKWIRVHLPFLVISMAVILNFSFNFLLNGNSSAISVYGVIGTISVLFLCIILTKIFKRNVFLLEIMGMSIIFWQIFLVFDPWFHSLYTLVYGEEDEEKHSPTTMRLLELEQNTQDTQRDQLRHGVDGYGSEVENPTRGSLQKNGNNFPPRQ